MLTSVSRDSRWDIMDDCQKSDTSKTNNPKFLFRKKFILSYLNCCLLKIYSLTRTSHHALRTDISQGLLHSLATDRWTSTEETTECFCWGVQVSPGGRLNNTKCYVSRGFHPCYQLLVGLQLRLKASIWCLGRATIRVSADRLCYHMFSSWIICRDCEKGNLDPHCDLLDLSFFISAVAYVCMSTAQTVGKSGFEKSVRRSWNDSMDIAFGTSSA